MNRSIFICPVCSSLIERNGRSYKCISNHSYDLSKEGYLNLLLANQKQSPEPGDSKEMLDARKSFLNRGYYKPLARAVASLIIRDMRRLNKLSPHGNLTYCQRHAPAYNSGVRIDTSAGSELHRPGEGTSPVPGNVKTDYTILDAGCGEGYYTDFISRNRYVNESASIYGVDISKEGIRSAAKRNSNIRFAVAGIYNLPVIDNSVDTILNIFAPFSEGEFRRVLKNDGIIISVTPGARHLYEFKKHLYDEVYLNDEEFELPAGLASAVTTRVNYELNVYDQSDISNLLKMTPYYHKSHPERIRSFLSEVTGLKTTADFIIRVLKKR